MRGVIITGLMNEMFITDVYNVRCFISHLPNEVCHPRSSVPNLCSSSHPFECTPTCSPPRSPETRQIDICLIFKRCIKLSPILCSEQIFVFKQPKGYESGMSVFR